MSAAQVKPSPLVPPSQAGFHVPKSPHSLSHTGRWVVSGTLGGAV
jgi:hypothetical protein